MPIKDTYKTFTSTLGDPVTHAVGITPSDTEELSRVTRALYVGVAGDVRVSLSGGSTVTFASMTAGWHPVRVTQVHSTGTTATHIIGCW